jgi:hypothetical protein
MKVLRYQQSNERWRFLIPLFIIAALVGVVALGVFHNRGAADISQFAGPISTLAGLAAGWLFTAGRNNRNADGQPEAEATSER